MSFEVDLEVPEPDTRYHQHGPSQHCIDPRRQLLHVERLGDIVIGADAQPTQLVLALAARRNNNHAATPALAQNAADLEAVWLPGEHDIEQDQIRSKRPRFNQRVVRGPRPPNIEAVDSEVICQHPRDSFVVFDDEDALLIIAHAGAIGMASVAVVPEPRRLSRRNEPRWATAMRRTIAKPSPLPRLAAPPRTNGC